MPEWLKSVLYLLAALASGAVGSLIAPWANWKIEKKKIRLNQRIELLKRFKGNMNTFGWEEAISYSPTDYAQLREHLNKKIISEIEDYLKRVKAREKGTYELYHSIKPRLASEIAQLEKKWGIF